ncbi:MAG: MarR family transcriptional regulator [Nitrospinota bacterium]|nr:MarR family transcriptional regulator [Nitrospinota bacterium]
MPLDFSDTIGRYISITWRHMSARLAKKLGPYGIGAGQFPILFILFIEDGLSQQAIAQKMATDKAAVTRAISALERRGYVRRLPDHRDKRAYNVRLTAKAKNLRPELEGAVMEILEQMQAGLDPTQRAELKKLLKQTAMNLCGQ